MDVEGRGGTARNKRPPHVLRAMRAVCGLLAGCLSALREQGYRGSRIDTQIRSISLGSASLGKPRDVDAETWLSFRCLPFSFTTAASQPCDPREEPSIRVDAPACYAQPSS